MENEFMTFADKHILITGGAGFIGSSLAHRFSQIGAKVTILDAFLPLYGGNEFNFQGIEDRVTVVRGDVRDRELMEMIVQGKDLIIDLAAQVSYIDSKNFPYTDAEINALSHLILLEAVSRHVPKAKVLLASSRLVYGKIQQVPVSESHPTNPVSLYGIHKLTAEKYFQYYSNVFGMDTICIRIPNPYGPRQQMKHNKYSIVGWFIRQAMENKPITIFGDGGQERDYLYIDDIVEAFLKLAIFGKSGEIYNIGAIERSRFIDMVDNILDIVKKGKKQHIPWPENYEKNETGNYIADIAKIKNHANWQPQINLRDGIQRTVNYYQKYYKYYWK